MKEKLVPLIQGPSDTKELHMSRWLNEIRKPESLLAPDLLAFSVQVPQQGDDCRNSGMRLLNVCITCSSSFFPLIFWLWFCCLGLLTGTDYICTIDALIQEPPFV